MTKFSEVLRDRFRLIAETTSTAGDNADIAVATWFAAAGAAMIKDFVDTVELTHNALNEGVITPDDFQVDVREARSAASYAIEYVFDRLDLGQDPISRGLRESQHCKSARALFLAV